MGWETILLAPICFNRKTYNHLGEVQEDLDEIKDCIKRYKEKLYNLSFITEPKKFCDDTKDPVWWLKNEVEETLEYLIDDVIEEYKLEVLIENWEKCHKTFKENNKSVEKGITTPPELGSIYSHCYIDGDFVDAVWPNGEKIPDEYYKNKKEYCKSHNINQIDVRDE